MVLRLLPVVREAYVDLVIAVQEERRARGEWNALVRRAKEYVEFGQTILERGRDGGCVRRAECVEYWSGREEAGVEEVRGEPGGCVRIRVRIRGGRRGKRERECRLLRGLGEREDGPSGFERERAKEECAGGERVLDELGLVLLQRRHRAWAGGCGGRERTAFATKCRISGYSKLLT